MEIPAYDPDLPCDRYQEEERKAKDGITERFRYCLQNGRKVRDGAFESRYPSGRPAERGGYAFGKKTGDWLSWHPDGKKKVVSRYADGRLDGLSVEFWPGGRIKDEFKYRDGRIDCVDGYHRSYYEKGGLKVDFGIRDGRLVRYVIYDKRGKAMPLPTILGD